MSRNDQSAPAAAVASAPTHQHPLADRDGQRKYIFSCKNGDENKKLFLRVITSGEEVAKHSDAIRLYKHIVYESHQQFTSELKRQDKQLKTVASRPTAADEDARIVAVPKQFGKEDNFTYFIIENESGGAAGVLSMSINGPTFRRDLKVPDDVKAFSYFHGIIIEKSYAGSGVFASAFDEIISLISQKFESSVEIAIPVGSMRLIDNKEYVGHAEMYAALLKKICGDGNVLFQERLRNGWELGNEKAQGERFPASNDRDICKLMTELRSRVEISPGDGIGLYVIGKMDKTHEVFEREKAERMQARVRKEGSRLSQEPQEKSWATGADLKESPSPILNGNSSVSGLAAASSRSLQS